MTAQDREPLLRRGERAERSVRSLHDVIGGPQRQFIPDHLRLAAGAHYSGRAQHCERCCDGGDWLSGTRPGEPGVPRSPVRGLFILPRHDTLGASVFRL
jgi:hypothetical protein